MSLSASSVSGFLAAFFSSLLWCVLLAVLPQQAQAQAPSQSASQTSASTRLGSWIAQAEALSLAQHPLWAVLLHHDGKQFTIPAAKFLLSAPQRGLREELHATLGLLDARPEVAICRFPARYLWLRTYLNLPDWAVAECPELLEFKQRAPMDRVSLVFASESLKSPASIMGHIFLKIDGADAKDRRLSHTVAFFTDADTYNFPKLLFDSVVTGMVGHYALTPYSEDVRRYVNDEQRNLWEFELRLTPSQLTLMQAHLIELKNSEFTYFFQKHNCATLIRFIIALGAPELASPPGTSWDSPRSVLKRADGAGLLGQVRTLTPSAWQVRMLAEILPRSARRSWVDLLNSGCDLRGLEASHSEDALLSYSWAQAWARWQSANAPLNERARWRDCTAALQAHVQARWGDTSMESNTALNPLQAPPEAQVALGIRRQHGHSRLTAELWALSHGLEDDHRSAHIESAQGLLGLTLSHQVDSHNWRLDQAILYEMKALQPWDSQLGGHSSHVRLAWAPVAASPLITRPTWVAEWGHGITWRAHRDVDVFGLLVLGSQWRDGLHVVARPVLGTIVRELGDMKTTVQIDRTWNNLGQGWGPLMIEATQSIYLNRQWSMMLNHGIQHQGHITSRQSSLTLKHLF
jgi:hypothetical protein